MSIPHAQQTFERGKVHSDTPECVGCELDWSMLAFSLVRLLTKKQELMNARIDPQEYNPATAQRLLRRELRHQAVGCDRLDMSELRTAIQDPQKASQNKKARHDQLKKQDPASGVSTLRKAINEKKAAKVFPKPMKSTDQKSLPALSGTGGRFGPPVLIGRCTSSHTVGGTC